MSAENGSAPDDGHHVVPGLVPTQWKVENVVLGEGSDDPLPAVMLIIRTPSGDHITFWPEDTAIGLAVQLHEAAEALRSA